MYNFEAYPPRGGNHVHAMELTQGFIRCGHSVSVVGDSTMPGVTNFDTKTEELQDFIDSIDILYVRIDARFLMHWDELKRCMRLIGDLPVVWEINSPANETLAYSWLSGKSSSIKESYFKRLKRFIHAAKKIPGIYLEERFRKKMAKNVSAAICVSKALGRYATDALVIAEVLILPNGGQLMSEDEIRQRREHGQLDGFTVLYSGSAMYPWQGLNYLSEVIKLALKEAPDISFVLAVNQRVPDLPATDNVVVLEHLDREKILDAICASDACVSLHPEYPWSKYGFHNSPMKLFEYMACMRPVVTSNHGQMKEIINDGVNGLLCTNDAKDILEKLVLLKNDSELAARLGRNGWECVQQEFSWQCNVEKTLVLFEKILAKSDS